MLYGELIVPDIIACHQLAHDFEQMNVPGHAKNTAERNHKQMDPGMRKQSAQHSWSD